MINTNICNFFDADYEGHLKKLLEIKGHIEQYNIIHKKSIITNELKGLISTMINNNTNNVSSRSNTENINNSETEKGLNQ